MTNITTLTLFIIIYIFISVQRFPFIKIDRPAGVFTGVTLLILAGVITLEKGYSFIDWNVITFLLGMMVMLSYLQKSGFFGLAAYYITKVCKTPKLLLLGVITSCALLSALFVNDTICLLMTPIIIAAVRAIKANPMPYLMGVALSSNIGSALTITGNPQNMYIGIATSVGFLHFMKITIVPVIVSLCFCYFILIMFYRKDMNAEVLQNIPIEIPAHNKILIYKSLSVLLLTMILFISGVNYPLAALIGATIIILISRIKPAEVFVKIDWSLLLFFAGLFIVMGAFKECGYADYIINLYSGDVSTESLYDLSIFSLIALTLSNLVSNVPAVILMLPSVTDSGAMVLPTMLALIATFAGNLTLVGSVANLIVAERAGAEGVEFKFFEHIKLGLPITIFSCIITVIWIYLISSL